MLGKPEDRLLRAIAYAEQISADLPDERRLAYDLFGASFFQNVADSRFMLLMMALETMIEQRPRERDVIAHIDTLIRDTEDSRLSPNSIQSLCVPWRLCGTNRLGKLVADSTYARRTTVHGHDAYGFLHPLL